MIVVTHDPNIADQDPTYHPSERWIGGGDQMNIKAAIFEALESLERQQSTLRADHPRNRHRRGGSDRHAGGRHGCTEYHHRIDQWYRHQPAVCLPGQLSSRKSEHPNRSPRDDVRAISDTLQAPSVAAVAPVIMSSGLTSPSAVSRPSPRSVGSPPPMKVCAITS